MVEGRKFNPEEYVSVAERLEKFWVKYPNGRIITEIITNDDKKVSIKASVFREANDVLPATTGHAEELREASFVNKTSALENGETSSVGRALALMGFEVKKGIASREEMGKVQRTEEAMRTGGVNPTAEKVEPPSAPPAPQSSEEKCQNCNADLSKGPFAAWIKSKREKVDPNFPSICPDCYRSQTKVAKAS